MERPVLGRAGAGALILVALLAVTQAVSAGVVSSAHAQVDARTAAAGIRTDLPKVRPLSGPPEAEAPKPVVPLGRPAIRVPILMYHYIRVNPVAGDQLGFNLSVTPDDFRTQMDWLAANDYHPIDFNDLRAYFEGRQPLPARPVIITLDDGYKDLYTTAYPILRAHGFKAVAYIVFGFLGAPHNVNADQVREMDLNGIEIASHTVSHADLTRTGDLARELVESKQGLEGLVGHPVRDFCYPSGQFNARVVAAVRAAGYDTATTTQPGLLHDPGDRYTWTRVRVSGGEGLPQFISNLGQPEPTETPAPDPNAKPHLRFLPKLPLIFPLLPPLPPPAAVEAQLARG